MYSKTVMDHFRNPRNVGVIEDADGVAQDGLVASLGHKGYDMGYRDGLKKAKELLDDK